MFYWRRQKYKSIVGLHCAKSTLETHSREHSGAHENHKQFREGGAYTPRFTATEGEAAVVGRSQHPQDSAWLLRK